MEQMQAGTIIFYSGKLSYIVNTKIIFEIEQSTGRGTKRRTF